MTDVGQLSHSLRGSEIHEYNETHSDIEQSFRQILRWIGEDPDRDGLRETPARLIRAYQE